MKSPIQNRDSRNAKIPFLEIHTRYLRYLLPYWNMLSVSVGLILIAAALEVLAPWPLKFIVDNVLGGDPFGSPIKEILEGLGGTDKRSLTYILGIALLAVTILQGLAAFAYEYLNSLIQEKATLLLRSDVFNHVQSLPLQFFDRTKMGDLLKRVTEDAGKIMLAVVGSMGEFLVNFIKFLGFAIVMLFVNWRFSIIVLAYVPLIMILYMTFRTNIRDSAREARKKQGEMMNLTLETFGAIREIKAFGRESQQLNKFNLQGSQLIRTILKSIRWEASFSPVIDFVQATSTAAIIWYGVSQVLIGQFSVGELLIFMSYLKDMYRPLRRFSKLATTMQKAAASGDRLAGVLDVEDIIPEVPDPETVDRVKGYIWFNDVSFAYPGAPNIPVLKNINLRIMAGQNVALIGHTGAGKSTIGDILMRFYDPTEGKVWLDNFEIQRLKLRDLRRQFAVVPQESVLFAMSVQENIAMGNPEATLDQVVAAAKAANAHDFILRLPDGYATQIGERGGNLSGGQRQRIAIARAILRNAPILILDEPTASLDAESEELVMGALHRLMRHRTTIIIAHRLATIREADLIVVLREGQIVETGTHENLMGLNGVYARMIALQSVDGSRNDKPLISSPPGPAIPEVSL